MNVNAAKNVYLNNYWSLFLVVIMISLSLAQVPFTEACTKKNYTNWPRATYHEFSPGW